MSQSSIQNFLRNSGVTVVRNGNATPRRMDPFSTPPSTPTRVRRAPETLSAPSPLAKRRALSLSPMRVRPNTRVVATPSPPRSKARLPYTPPRVVPSASKLTFEPLQVMMATAVTETKRVGGAPVSMARLLARKLRTRAEPLVVAGRHYKIRTLRINGRDRLNRVVKSPAEAKTVEYNVEVTSPSGKTATGSLYVYASGNVRYSGAVPGGDFAVVHAIQRFVVYTYTQRQRFLYNPMKFSNVTGQFRGNFTLNPMAFAKFLRLRNIPFSYEPELQQYFFKVHQGKQSFLVRKTGLVQLFKASNPTQLQRIYSKAKDLLSSANLMGMLVAPTGYASGFHSPPRAKKRALPNVPTTPKVTRSVNGSVCIDGKSCDKYKKADLLAFAKKMNVFLPKHVLKPEIIRRIGGDAKTNTGMTLKNIREELWSKHYDQRLLKNDAKRKIFKERLENDTRKIKAVLERLPKRHRAADTGNVKKTIRDEVFREVSSDSKAYVELSMEVDKYLKEAMTP